MLKLEEYRQHAEECRALARKMPAGEKRDQLLRMAETWDSLARERESRMLAQEEPVPKQRASN